MNILRLVCTISGYLLLAIALITAIHNGAQIEWAEHGRSYLWSSLVGSVLIPVIALVASSTVLFLIARIDRRLEQLQVTESENG